MNNQRSNPSSTFSNYNFDFGVPSRSSSSSAHRPLKPTAAPPTPPPSRPPSAAPSWTPNKPSWTHQPSAAAAAAPSWTPNKPSWTHQPSPPAARSAASNASSMVGDIFGKSWSNPTPTPSPAPSSIGIPRSDPNLFGDLVGAALGQGKPTGNAPLKAAPPRNAYSMGNLADSLPKPSSFPASRGSAEDLRSYGSSRTPAAKSTPPVPANGQGTDPFSNLMGFGVKPPAGNSGKGSGSGGDFSFGEFQSSSARGNAMSSSNKGSAAPAGVGDSSFGDLQNSGALRGGGVEFSFESFQGTGSAKSNAFGVPPAPQSSHTTNVGIDPLDNLFSSSAGTTSNSGGGSQSFGEVDDWDVGGAFEGSDGGGPTTELDGLPPPPSGVTVSVAMSKGLDNYKQGQFADAIKWLSWAVILIEKSGNVDSMTEALTCRASCYKEAGEYKKAIADCSKVLDSDSKNVAVLVQRALLYESTEKYKLGAEDLRAVLRIDPTNRLAKTTIHRLTQLAG